MFLMYVVWGAGGLVGRGVGQGCEKVYFSFGSKTNFDF